MKYIDLINEIHKNTSGEVYRIEIAEILRYLDDHPELTGKAITESRYRAFTDSASEEYQAGFSDGFFFADGLVIPDPEPTNAQSIDKLLTEFANLNASCGGEQGDHDLAEFLDAHGVKAMGADDE